MSRKNPARRACPDSRKRTILEYQGYVCVYCAIPFGSVIVKRGRLRVSSCHLDHFVPLAYLNSNPARNWVAACNFCNLIKASLMFTSLADARSFILDIRDKRGDYIEWYAPYSCEEDPQRWAVKFATFLASLGSRRIDATDEDDDELLWAQNREAAIQARRSLIIRDLSGMGGGL